MSLILHMKIPGALVVASDCQVTNHTQRNGIDYKYITTNAEQKSFLVNDHLAVSYCGNAGMGGIPTSCHLRELFRNNRNLTTTFAAADLLDRYFTQEGIQDRPHILISGYNSGRASVVELTAQGGNLNKFFEAENSFGLAYQGEISVPKAIVNLGKFEYALFRPAEAIGFCEMLITTTAKVLRYQSELQSVSEEMDILLLTPSGARWIRRSSLDI
ncbi:MAG: hypothetical protein K5849_03240 [Bacteroidales bacterium]|nr:hypothetical protein [Bacteroidales bacterium]